LTTSQKDRLWNDPNYGFKTGLTLNAWLKATQQGISSNIAIMLTNHFYLSKSQTMQVIDSLKFSYDAAMLTMANLFKCPNNLCTSKYLIAVQWASQNVTQGVPLPSIPALPSITSLNQTVFGYPEFSYFYKELFLPKHDSTEYQNITMDAETAVKLTNVSLEGEPLVTDQYT